jgi:hypothetical protein
MMIGHTNQKPLGFEENLLEAIESPLTGKLASRKFRRPPRDDSRRGSCPCSTDLESV